MLESLKITAAVVAATLALSACGGGQKQDGEQAAAGDAPAVAESGGKDIDPCSLLTGEEVSAITTDAVIGTKRDDNTCYYQGRTEALRLQVLASGGIKQMQANHQAANLLQRMGQSVADKGGAGKDTAELLKKNGAELPKLGDEAFWGMNNELAVRKGDAYVEVLAPMMHDPANHSGYPLVPKAEMRKIAIAVAEKVLPKLP